MQRVCVSTLQEVWIHRVRRSECLGLGGQGELPGQEIVDAVDGVIRDDVEDVAEVGFRVDAVEFGGTDEGVDRSGAVAAAVGAGKEIVLAAQGHGAQSPFSGVVVDFDIAEFGVEQQGRPELQGIGDGLEDFRLFGDLSLFVQEPTVQAFEYRDRVGLTC